MFVLNKVKNKLSWDSKMQAKTVENHKQPKHEFGLHVKICDHNKLICTMRSWKEIVSNKSYYRSAKELFHKATDENKLMVRN
jgi:hypothetical protein